MGGDLLERAPDDAIERRDGGAPRKRRRLFVDDGVEHVEGGAAVERRTSRQHLVEHDA